MNNYWWTHSIDSYNNAYAGLAYLEPQLYGVHNAYTELGWRGAREGLAAALLSLQGRYSDESVNDKEYGNMNNFVRCGVLGKVVGTCGVDNGEYIGNACIERHEDCPLTEVEYECD